MYDSNPLELFKYLLPELSKTNLHFVEIKKHADTDAKASASNPHLDEKG